MLEPVRWPPGCMMHPWNFCITRLIALITWLHKGAAMHMIVLLVHDPTIYLLAKPPGTLLFSLLPAHEYPYRERKSMGIATPSGLLITTGCSVTVWAAFLLELSCPVVLCMSLQFEQNKLCHVVPSHPLRLFKDCSPWYWEAVSCIQLVKKRLQRDWSLESTITATTPFQSQRTVSVSARAVKSGWEKGRKNNGSYWKAKGCLLLAWEEKMGVAIKGTKLWFYGDFSVSYFGIGIFDNLTDDVVPQSLTNLREDLDSVCINIYAHVPLHYSIPLSTSLSLTVPAWIPSCYLAELW